MNTIRKNNKAMSVMLAPVLMAGLLVIPYKTVKVNYGVTVVKR